MCIVLISLQLLTETFSHSKKNEARNHKCTDVSMQSSCSSSPIFIVLELSRQVSAKNSNIKVTKMRPVGTKMFHADGQTDKPDEANGRFLQLWERV
jgi:hypothetical protein